MVTWQPIWKENHWIKSSYIVFVFLSSIISTLSKLKECSACNGKFRRVINSYNRLGYTKYK